MNTEVLLKELEDGLVGVTPGPYEANSLAVMAGREMIVQFGISNNFRPPRPEECARNAAHYARCSPDTIRALLSLIREERSAREKAEAERDEARAERVVVGDWASQRENDQLTIQKYEWKDRATAAESELARLRGELAGGWRVKPLVWGTGLEASSPVGNYRVQRLDDKWEPLRDGYYMLPKQHGVVAAFDTCEAAKAAAQADYEARIRAAIEPATQETKHG